MEKSVKYRATLKKKKKNLCLFYPNVTAAISQLSVKGWLVKAPLEEAPRLILQ